MYRSKRTIYDQWIIFAQESSNRIYLRQFYLFVELHIREYATHCFGEHGFSTSGRTLHEDVVSSCRSDKECSFCMLLAVDMRKIGFNMLGFFLEEYWFCSLWHGFFSCQDIYHLSKRGYSNHVDIGDYGCLRGIVFWEKDSFHAEFSGEYGCWQSSLYGPEETIESQFPEKHGSLCSVFAEFNFLSKYSQRNREIIDGSFFLQVSGCKVDGYASSTWKGIARIFYSTSYAFATFLDGCIAESNDCKLSHASYNVNFYLNQLS